jgi:hypothetical protein
MFKTRHRLGQQIDIVIRQIGCPADVGASREYIEACQVLEREIAGDNL